MANRMTDSQREEVARVLEQVARDGEEQLRDGLDAALDAIAETVLPDTITRYFEAHVTMEPDPEHTFEEFVEALTIGGSGWRASRFEADHVDHIAGKWFASYRSTSHAEIVNEVRLVVHSFLAAGTEVLRWKIEETLLDSRLGDVL